MENNEEARFENFEGKTIEKFYIFDKIGEGINNVGNEIGAGLNNITGGLGLEKMLKAPPKPKYPYSLNDILLKQWKKMLSQVKLQIWYICT